MPASPLTERVAELIGRGAQAAPAPQRQRLEELRQRLVEPVRIAVVGPVNAGKSTVVNALLGQKVAPTDVSECTRLVCWFRYGRPQRVEVEALDGARHTVALDPGGTLPAELPVPAAQVRTLQCFLANERLKSLTLIDTPGIGSVHGDFSRATTDLLSASGDSREAVGQADAVVFLFSQVLMDDDLKALQSFRDGDADGSGGASTVGVLSRADQLGDGERDPWEIALELAGAYARRFEDTVAAVVPVVGLLAETAGTAALTEADANLVEALAAMDDKAFRRLLWSTDRFASADAPIAPEDRERLLGLLDLWGVRRAVDGVRAGRTGAGAIREVLVDTSGIGAVEAAIAAYVGDHDETLKLRSVLDEVERLTYVEGGSPGAAALAQLRADVEALRLDPEMHPVAELLALRACTGGAVGFPADQLAELTRLLRPGPLAGRLGTADDPGTMEAAARDGMVRWQAFMGAGATPAQAGISRVARRSYQLIWSGLQRR